MRSTIAIISISFLLGAPVWAADQASPPNSLTVSETNGEVGVGTGNPMASLHVIRATPLNSQALLIESADNLEMGIRNASSPTGTWRLRHPSNGNLIFATAADNNVVQFSPGGGITVNGTPLMVPDYVLEPDYELMPLDELAAFIREKGHLPDISSAEEVKQRGLNVTEMQMSLLRKVEELVLYTLEQQKTIDALKQRLDAVESQQ